MSKPDSDPEKSLSLQSLLIVGVAISASAHIGFFRDAGTGGPHHDEVIALLAANGMQREWYRMSEANEAPLHEIVSASEWHTFTRGFSPVTFSEIRSDVLAWDKHPPLAFWVLNRWMSLFPDNDYNHAVLLIWLQLLIAAGILSYTVYRCTANSTTATIAFAVFLCGNSAVFTGIWVRQYGLFIVCFAMLTLAAAEIVRKNMSRPAFTMWSAVVGLTCLLGMMCQYTFSTMSGPIHLAILATLASRRQWPRVGILMIAYAAAGILFFILLPGVLNHVSAVSEGLQRRWQLSAALSGLPRMFIPIPSSAPIGILNVLGWVSLLFPLVVAIAVVRLKNKQSEDNDLADVRVPLAGMLGTGVLQFIMVAMGFYPGWATGENHMCAFWLLTVLATSVLLMRSSARVRNVIITLAICGMLGMQSLFIWHTNRILPRINTSYIASQKPDLVCIDNLARGFVLQVTDVIPPNDQVLATDSDHLSDQLKDGRLPDRILYLPMDTTVKVGKGTVVAAAQQGGYAVKELPVVHTGMYEAFLLSRHGD